MDSRFDLQRFVIEWLERDFLNVCFGNSDNHGRNHALLKTPTEIALSPIYDFAPMRADPEGIIRSIQWGSPFEIGGQFNWQAICEKLNQYVPQKKLITLLKHRAQQLRGLKLHLARHGAPASILEMPSMGFDFLDDKLRQWGLIV